MNQYCSKLNFEFSPLIDGFDFSKLNRHFNARIDDNIINPNLISIVNSFNSSIVYAEYSYGVPGLPRDIIHVDKDKIINDIGKLTWFSTPTVVDWYTIKPEILSTSKSPRQSRSGSTYYAFEEYEVDLAYSEELSGFYLIQTGVPYRTPFPDHAYNLNFIISTYEAIENKREGTRGKPISYDMGQVFLINYITG